MKTIVIKYWDKELKKININPENEKEIENALKFVIDTVFTVMSSNDAIYIGNIPINSPEKLEEEILKEIKNSGTIVIKIKPFIMENETRMIEKSSAVERLIEQTYIPKF